jgi:glycosyltransferase involved in cell wall biosynthesis
MEYEEQSAELSIIIPAYNEEKGIATVLENLCKEPSLYKAEIIVVDDGSSDSTSAKIEMFPRVHLVKHRVNQGYGAAIITGVHASTRRYIIWFDADGQHRIEDLKVVSQALIGNSMDYCIGIRDGRSYQEIKRKFGKYILKLTVRLAAGQKVRDYNSGLRGFKKEVLKCYLHLLPRGFGASTTTTLLMLERGYIGGEIPIIVSERIGISSVKQFRDGFQTIVLILRIFLLFKPLQFFGSIGITALVLGSVYGIWEAIAYRLGFPVFAAIVIIFGLQSFFFGLLCDQVSSLRRERFEK